MNRDAARQLLLSEIRQRRTRLQSLPATVNVEFTGKCHVHPPCTYCVGKNSPGYQEPGHISDSHLEQYWPYLLQAARVNDCTYGELHLYPGHETVIRRLSAAGVKFGFTTIGQLLTEKRARFLIEHADTLEFAISLNAATPETYTRYHGSGFELVIRNVERFVALHRQLRPGMPMPFLLSFIVMSGNRHEVFDFLRLAKRIGAERIIFRHLFDMRAGNYAVNSFGYNFVYEAERLPYASYLALHAQVENNPEFDGLKIYFEWTPGLSFIEEQAEPGVDIPCLFPWKFLSIRPLHDMFTPCCFLKRSIATPSQTTVEEVWNGEIMVGMRTELAAGRIPHYCRTYGDACPLVLQSHRSPELLQIASAAK
jgi:MoaA/NifB/PqqE/SkfB family radical SAM enzyme